MSIKQYDPEIERGDHYVCYGKDGDVLSTINCLIPCEVYYLKQEELKNDL